jgi:hypothetical protein
MPAARAVRAGLALAAALLLAAGIGGCGARSDKPVYRAGYQAGLTAHDKLILEHGPVIGDITWLCAMLAYKDIQAMRNSTAVSWQEGFDKGCANSSI